MQLHSVTLIIVILAYSQAFSAPPNIVFIIADDLGWADVGFHGGSAPTPHLDQLARDGLELTQHYVAPVCSPTRAGFLTGRYWSRFGITTPINQRGLPWRTLTVQGALRSCGYSTCLVGKWHLGSRSDWGPNHYDFEHSYGSLAGGITAWSHLYKKGDFSRTWHRNEELIEEQGHVTDLLANEAVAWIDARDDSPFFLYVPFTAVHLPINEPTEWLERVPPSIQSEIGRQYAACIMHLDAAVGQIVTALERKGMRDNTLLVFTSDNGGSTATNNTQPYPPDDSPPGKLPADNGLLRGQKGSVYEGGTRVPTIVCWPSRVAAGKEDTPVCIVDWLPTFCSLCGYEPDSLDKTSPLDGVDLSPLLAGRSLSRRSIYVAGPRWRQVSLRSGRWKLVQNAGQPDELFDIQSDPYEQEDVASQNAAQLKWMREQLQEARRLDSEDLLSGQR